MRGFICVLQWYHRARHIDYFNHPELMTGDAAAIRDIVGYSPPKIHDTPPNCPIGHVIFRIEHDGKLTLLETNYDSSD